MSLQRTCTLFVVGFLAVTLGTATFGQAPSKAGQAYSQAVALHMEDKIAPALAKIKEAVAAAPKTKQYTDYQAELTKLAAREEFDQYALKTPADVEQTVDSLAAYLAKGGKTDEEKARLIFRWITDRIAYDTQALFSGRPGDNSPAGVLKSRKAICGGFSDLFNALATKAGLETARIDGYAKGIGYTTGKKLDGYAHAWNAVKLDGQWRLIDSMWGSGDVSGPNFQKRTKNFYFLAPPEQFIYTHLPSNPKWQQLPTPVERGDFEKWPVVNYLLFDQYGVNVKDVSAKLADKDFREFVEVQAQPGPKIVLHSAPLDRHLKAGSKYRFRIEAPSYQDLTAAMGQKFVPLVKKGNAFEAEVTAQKGSLIISGKQANPKATLTAVFRYTVD